MTEQHTKASEKECSVFELESSVIYHIKRHSVKNGRADVEEAIRYCRLILELVYGEKHD